jgi:hypothetical protein
LTKFNKITTIILIFYILGWSIYRKVTIDTFALVFHATLTVFVCLPLLLSVLFYRCFAGTIRPNKLQWIPDLLLLFILLGSVVSLLVGVFTKDENYEQLKIQKKDKKEVVHSITKWINENSSYPKTYKPIDLTYLFSIGSLFTDTNKLENFKQETKTKQGYFFARHIFQLQDNNHITKRDTAYFQLLPNYQVTNVRTKSEANKYVYETTEYEWKKRYGNSIRSLELEIYGNNTDTYIFHQYTNEGGKQATAIYSNGKLNGDFFVYNFYNDTLIVANYRDGKALSVKVKQEPNKNTYPELYDTKEYFIMLSKQIMNNVKNSTAPNN